MTVIEIIKAKLGETTITDEQIELAMSETRTQIINYCNINEIITPAMDFIYANMTVDLLKKEYPTSTSGEVSTAGIKKIKIGDADVEFGSGSSNSSSSSSGSNKIADMNAILYSYTPQLNKFRSLWK